jgi:hypothetical protein
MAGVAGAEDASAAVIPCKHPLNCRRESLRQAAASGAIITSHMNLTQNQKVDQHNTTCTTCIGNAFPLFRCTNTTAITPAITLSWKASSLGDS